jgi:hypothetical protein
MIKRLITLIIVLSPVLLSAQNFGLGVILGSPTGLSFKYVLSKHSAFSAHAGWSFIGDKGIHLTGDYQHLFPMVFETAEGTSISDLTPYIAFGGRFRFKEQEGTEDNEFHLGLRIGGGAEYLISRFGIFAELVPVVNLVPSTDFDFEGGLGLLFYF